MVMQWRTCFSILLCFGLIACKPKIEKRDLSDVEHHEDDKVLHNEQYDREAFLGKEGAEESEHMSDEESKAKLGKLFDKIDANKDQKVSSEELKQHIAHVSTNYIREDVNTQFGKFKSENDLVSWSAYKNETYGADEDEESAKDIIRDERRWKFADSNGDNKLNKDEFTSFLHPEEDPKMSGVVVNETLDSIDKDKDGRISRQEYLDDLWHPDGESKEEPSWLESEKESFTNDRDKNKDGYLDLEEIRLWVAPHNYDNVEAETKHLMQTADDNKDGLLDKNEVLNHHSVFIGSQATDYGDALKHDEL